MFLQFETPEDFNPQSDVFVRFVTHALEDIGGKISISSFSLIAMKKHGVYRLIEGTSLNEIKKKNGHLVLDFGCAGWVGISVPIEDYKRGGIYRLKFQGKQLNQQGFASIRNNDLDLEITGAVIPRGAYYDESILIVPFVAPRFRGHELVVNMMPMHANDTGGEMHLKSLVLERLDL